MVSRLPNSLVYDRPRKCILNSQTPRVFKIVIDAMSKTLLDCYVNHRRELYTIARN